MTRFHPLRQTAILGITLTLAALPLNADPIRVTQPQGALHGFLEVRSPAGDVIGHGDVLQTVQGNRVTIERILHFKDSSVDDDTAVFTQDRTFRLLSDRHIQKGPFFPEPLDMLIEASGQITTRTAGSDGKEKVETQHLDLPSDVANGIIGPMLMSVPPTTPEFHLSMVLPLGKGRVAKLATAPEGERSFTGAGVQRKATVFDVKIELGGMLGMLAGVAGKQPADAHIWIVEGKAPEIVRVQQQLYRDGPVISIEVAGCTFPRS